MADVTVNIRGNADGLKRELDDIDKRAREVEESVNGAQPREQQPLSPPTEQQPTRQPVSPRQPAPRDATPLREPVPITDRLTEEMRRRMEDAGKFGSPEFNEAVDDLQKNSRERLNEEITNKYNDRRSALTEEMRNAYDKVDEDVNRQKEERINTMGREVYNDPLRKKAIDDQYESLRDSEYEKIGKSFDKRFEDLDEEEQTERETSEAQLTDAIRELIEELKRMSETGGGNDNSFMGRLREERRQAIAERDNATTEEEAVAAQQRVNDVDARLRRIARGETGMPEGDEGGFSGANALAGGVGVVNAASEGNVAGMAAQAALMIGKRAFLPLAIVAGLSKAITTGSSTLEGNRSLASLRGTSGGRTGLDALTTVDDGLNDGIVGGTKLSSLGLDLDEFKNRAFRTIRSSGTSEDWKKNTFESVAVERNLGLDDNALVQGAKYDRYGTNVVDAIVDLTNTLSDIRNSGVSGGDFTRVQEKFDIQQGIMASYMNRSDRPDYAAANRLVAGFSAVPVTQDQRTGTDIQAFQQGIQNPVNDRMRAMIYGVIGEMAPETRGRVDLAERFRLNPENEGKLIQAVVQRITQMFGGTDTTMGFMAFRQAFGDVIPPERMDEYAKAFSNPNSEASKRLLDEIKGSNNKVVNKEGSVTDASGLTPGMSSGMVELGNVTRTFLSNLVGGLEKAFSTPKQPPITPPSPQKPKNE